ncbi:MAG: hypothetical protein HY761_07785 [Candidatus Omnitrophica bacterium]|nr:hypothetical protein [Candidatus Omnitrophota bacterium]
MEKVRYDRDIAFDLLRAIIIFSALILHYDTNFHISIFAKPSRIFQAYIFTIGGFFFFTTGYMARKIYLKRFLQRPKQVSKKIFFKGFSILILYLVYVFLMHILTETKIPKSLITFIFDHKFFTKILFTFSILFMLTPIILFLYTRTPKLIIAMLALITLLVIIYDQNWIIPHSLKVIFFDRNLFLYSLFPSLVVYAGGFITANWESKISKSSASLKITH